MIAVLSIAGAFAIALMAFAVRRSHYPRFREWWDAEGMSIFLLAAFGVGIVLLSARGCEHLAQ